MSGKKLLEFFERLRAEGAARRRSEEAAKVDPLAWEKKAPLDLARIRQVEEFLWLRMREGELSKRLDEIRTAHGRSKQVAYALEKVRHRLAEVHFSPFNTSNSREH